MFRKFAAALLLAPLLFTSCIQFDGQNASYRHDVERDELRIFQVYERIHVERGRNNTPLTSREKGQLADLRLNQPTFFFGNWMFVLRRDQLGSQIEELEKKLVDPKARGEASVDLVRAELEICIALHESLQVVNGDFYTNDKGELCGYQMVRLANLKRLVKATNAYISATAVNSAKSGWSEKSKAKVLAAAMRSQWIEIDGNQISANFPIKATDYDEDSDDRKTYKADGKPTFLEKIKYEEPFLRAVVGKKDEVRTDLRVDNLQRGKYNDALLKHLREEGADIKKNVDIDKLRREFLK